MKEQEKLLFKSLCSFKSENFDEKLLESATPSVLGHLFFNRMQAIAYGTLKEKNLLNKVNREFRNSLKDAYEKNLEKNQSFFWCVKYLIDILEKCTCKYALLKGAYLCGYYPKGYRSSNDIDILVSPENISEIGNVLLEFGFEQGTVSNGRFIPATRKEIIESKILRGETVPYIKAIDLPGMKYLEVDINFSLDYKNGDIDILKDILNRVTIKKISDLEIPTLENCDFFIHLCSHLYKEATTLPWIEMKRDMTLYKYSDIYLLLTNMTNSDVNIIFKRSKKLGIDKVCAFAILQTSEIFDINNTVAIGKAKSVLKEDEDFIHKIISPKDKKTFVYYEKNVFERIFAYNRKDFLVEE